MFVGDSITSGDAIGTPYSDEFLTLRGAGVSGSNIAISGMRAVNASADEWSLFTDEAAKGIVLLGINDIGQGTSVATIFAAIKALWEEMLLDGVDTVYACTVMPAKADTYPKADILALNALIEAQTNPDVVVIPLYDSFALSPGGDIDTQWFLADQLHPNTSGTSRLANIIHGAIP